MQKKHKKVSPGIVLIYVVLSAWAVTTIYPILWVVLNSFKVKDKIMVDSFALPVGDLFTTANYKMAFERLGIATAYRNSMIISGTVALTVILLAGMASFALVRYQFRIRGFLMSLVVAGMMFPVFSTIIPVYQLQNKMGITATNSLFLNLLCVILPQIAGNLSFAIVVLTGYIKSLPIELEEAAYMEGSNAFQTFFKVVVPLTKPSFATVAIFSFLWSYNDLFTQMFFLRNKKFWGDHQTDADAYIQRGNKLWTDGIYGFAGSYSGHYRIYFLTEIHHQRNDRRSC